MTGSEYSQFISSSPRKAHQALFDEYFGYVWTIVFNRLRSVSSQEDIEECVSDVFAEVFMGYKDEGFSGDMKGYIGTVAKRRSIDRFRQLSGRAGKTVSIDEEGFSQLRDDTDVAGSFEKKEQARLLLEMIEALGEPDSTIIIQRYYYNRSSREIAGVLGMKASAVRMRCRRAAEKLKAALASVGILQEGAE